jgi:hypothetical protein
MADKKNPILSPEQMQALWPGRSVSSLAFYSKDSFPLSAVVVDAATIDAPTRAGMPQPKVPDKDIENAHMAVDNMIAKYPSIVPYAERDLAMIHHNGNIDDNTYKQALAEIEQAAKKASYNADA